MIEKRWVSLGFKIKLLVFFFYASVGVLIPFLPLVFRSQGMSSYQIGVLMAIGPFVSILVQSPWGMLSDKLQTVKKIAILQIAVSLLLSFFLFNLSSFYLLVLAVFVFCIFSIPLFVLLDCLIMDFTSKNGKSFGSYRLWGSIGFAVAALATGEILTIIGIENVEYLYQLMLLVSLFLSFLIADVAPSVKRPDFSSFKKLFFRKELLVILLLVTFISSTNKANDTFIGMFIQNIGGDENILGWAWMVGAVSEVLIFVFSASILRYKETKLLAIAAFIFFVRWALFVITDDPWTVVMIQVLHGLSFGLLYIAAVSYICAVSPAELRGSGMGLMATFFGGVAGIAGSLLGGFIIESFNIQTMYQISAVICLVSAASMFVLIKRKVI